MSLAACPEATTPRCRPRPDCGGRHLVGYVFSRLRAAWCRHLTRSPADRKPCPAAGYYRTWTRLFDGIALPARLPRSLRMPLFSILHRGREARDVGRHQPAMAARVVRFALQRLNRFQCVNCLLVNGFLGKNLFEAPDVEGRRRPCPGMHSGLFCWDV